MPPETVHRAVSLPGGGVSKVNVATDLEQALLAGLGGPQRMTSAELDQLDPLRLAQGLEAVYREASDKIGHFVRSAGRAGALPSR